MSDTTKAVFLSYAREDTEPARRIADALRSQGVEVWFDQSELRGGEAWDAKIREQIRECALFLAVISHRTQERHEGYFRREWKLAVERTHDMSARRAFLVPVVIDETPETHAEVPDEFLRVQWTRLPGALPTPQFVEQVKRLLEAPGAVAQRPEASGQPSETTSRPTTKPHAVARSGLPGWMWGVLLIIVAGTAVAVFSTRRSARPPSAVNPEPKTLNSEPSRSAAPDAKSIAVLPFENRSDDKENAYFTDGIQDDILTSLANLHDLRVISRTSVMEYRGTTKQIPQIARELGVAYLLEGAVERVGNSVHITGQLIRADPEEHLWAKSYDAELTATNLFAIQSQLAQAIAGELHAAISPAEQTQLDRIPTANLAAYELYSQGRAILYARGNDIEGMFKAATPLWERAVALDPNFALAWANLSGAYSLAYNRDIERTPAAKAKANDAIQTALRLAPDDPSVLLLLANYDSMVEGDYDRALADCERAARISRNNADLYDTLGGIYARQGRWADALAAARTEYELAPRSESAARNLGQRLLLARRYDEAEEVFRQALALQPDSWNSAAMLALTPFFARGSSREWDAWLAGASPSIRAIDAVQGLDLAVTADQGDAAGYVKLVARYHRETHPDDRYAFALKLSGQTGEARAVATHMRDAQLALVTREPKNATAWGRLAFAYAALGENSSALAAEDKCIALTQANSQSRARARMWHALLLAWLDRKDEAVKELAEVWWQPAPRVVVDTLTSFMWAPLQGDPRFEALKHDPRNQQPLY